MNCNSISVRSRGVAVIVEAIDCDTNAALDVSNSTSRQALISFNGGNAKTETLSLLNTGTDGLMVFVLPLDAVYFEETGNWDVDVIVSYADGVFPTINPSKILVKD